jgi:hypothetical protein
MKKITTAFLFLIPLISFSQTDVLILQKEGRNIKTYAPGMSIMLHTIYDQWLEGTVTDLRNDSVFLNNIPFHVQEIDGIRKNFSRLNLQTNGTILIIAGGGVLALNVINGIYTNEPAGSWIKPSGWITAGALILAGILMRSARYKNYPIGKKYQLHYLNMHEGQYIGQGFDSLEKKQTDTLPSSRTTEPAKQTDAH